MTFVIHQASLMANCSLNISEIVMALIIIFLPGLVLLEHYLPGIFLFAILFLLMINVYFVFIGNKPLYFPLLILVCLLSAKLIMDDGCKSTVLQVPSIALVEGEIMSIPHYQHRHVEFDFLVKDIHHPGTYHVSWYGITPDLHVHDIWRMTLKLKNGSFAYVSYDGPSVLLKRRHVWQSIDVLREQLAASIYRNVSSSARQLGAILVALSTGSRHLMDQDTWKVFQNTGTSHLVAISGLHVGLVASLMFVLMSLGSKVFIREGGFSRPQLCWFVSLIGATLYALFAGMGVSTIRAIIMLSLFIFARLGYRHIPFWAILLLALTFILYFLPLSAESISFWLSFGAVAMLAYVTHARLERNNGIKTWLLLQLQLFFGLLPLTLLFFSKVSLTMILANYIAIPYVSFIIVPLCLFSTVMHWVMPVIDSYSWGLTAKLLSPLWWFLAKLAAVPLSVWPYVISFTQFIFLTIGVLLMLAPQGWYGRKLAMICCLPACVPLANQPITLQVNKLATDLVLTLNEKADTISIVSSARARALQRISQSKLVLDLSKLTAPTNFPWHGVTLLANEDELVIKSGRYEIEVMPGLTKTRLEKYLSKGLTPDVMVFSAKKSLAAELAQQIHQTLPKTVIITNSYKGGCWLSQTPVQGEFYSTARNGSMTIPL